MYLGSTAIGKAYLGSDLVYDSAGGSPVLPYDAEIEYLQATGTQYIDTGIVGNQNTKIAAKFYPTQLDSFVYGCRGDNTNSITFFVASNDNERFGNQTYLASLTANTLYEVVQDKTKVTINGVDHNYGTVSNFTTPYNLYLFGASGTEYALSHKFNGRLYYMKIWNGDSLVRDFIPVRVGQVGYMYDRVSRQLLGNAGSGDFALGGDIIGNGAYVKCSYVVPSSSSSIFTTGVTALGSEWELDLQDTVTTSGNQVFICSNSYGGCFAAVNSSGKFALGASNVMTSASTRTTVGIEFINKGMIMTIGSGSTQRVGSYAHNQYVSLLGYNGNYLYQGKIYGIKCVSGGSFDAVPARRISDGVYGLYDTANAVFYTNFTGA